MSKSTNSLVTLPELPEHYNPIKALGEADRNSLLDAILSHYESGASIYALAEQLGVTNGAIYRQLIKYRPDDWKEVSAARYQTIIERAEEQLKNASDALTVTRAREELANAKWMLERLQRRIYGQDAPPAGANAVQININLRGSGATNAVQHEDNGAVTIEHAHK